MVAQADSKKHKSGREKGERRPRDLPAETKQNCEGARDDIELIHQIWKSTYGKAFLFFAFMLHHRLSAISSHIMNRSNKLLCSRYTFPPRPRPPRTSIKPGTSEHLPRPLPRG